MKFLFMFLFLLTFKCFAETFYFEPQYTVVAYGDNIDAIIDRSHEVRNRLNMSVESYRTLLISRNAHIKNWQNMDEYAGVQIFLDRESHFYFPDGIPNPKKFDVPKNFTKKEDST